RISSHPLLRLIGQFFRRGRSDQRRGPPLVRVPAGSKGGGDLHGGVVQGEVQVPGVRAHPDRGRLRPPAIDRPSTGSGWQDRWTRYRYTESDTEAWRNSTPSPQSALMA